MTLFITDPKSGIPSVSLTLVVASSFLVGVDFVATQMVLPFFKIIPLVTFDIGAATLLLTTTYALYFGRSMTGNNAPPVPPGDTVLNVTNVKQ